VFQVPCSKFAFWVPLEPRPNLNTNPEPGTWNRELLTSEQWLVIPVVLAEELVNAIVLREERERPRDQPWPCEHVGILDDGFVFEGTEARALESFDHV
jgi:hypothetical protein